MGRKTWVKPMTLVQKFEANESVAADTQCWRVACERPGGYFYHGLLEVHTACKDINNQWLYDEDGNGTPDKMVELGHDVDCTIYADSDYTKPLAFEDIVPSSGATIYWVNNYGMKYHHVGTIQQASAEHPNRS